MPGLHEYTQYFLALVLVIYCCLTNYPGIQKRTHLLSHSFWGTGIWYWLSWVVLSQCLSRGCNWYVSHGSAIWRFDGLEDLPPVTDVAFGLIYSYFWLEASVAYFLGTSVGLLTVWHLASPRANDKGEREINMHLDRTLWSSFHSHITLSPLLYSVRSESLILACTQGEGN